MEKNGTGKNVKERLVESVERVTTVGFSECVSSVVMPYLIVQLSLMHDLLLAYPSVFPAEWCEYCDKLGDSMSLKYGELMNRLGFDIESKINKEEKE